MNPERASGADFDPASAAVWGPGRGRLSSGEPNTTPVVVLTTRIKSPRAMYVSERENYGAPHSVNTMIIEVRNECGGDRLTSDMKIVHRDRTYQIAGKLPADWRKGVTPYQVVMTNDSIS